MKSEKKILVNLKLNLGKVYRKSVRTFESKNFRIIKSIPSGNHRDQYLENFKENLIKFYKKFEEVAKILNTTNVNF